VPAAKETKERGRKKMSHSRRDQARKADVETRTADLIEHLLEAGELFIVLVLIVVLPEVLTPVHVHERHLCSHTHTHTTQERDVFVG
jgi:hypothetical protein